MIAQRPAEFEKDLQQRYLDQIKVIEQENEQMLEVLAQASQNKLKILVQGLQEEMLMHAKREQERTRARFQAELDECVEEAKELMVRQTIEQLKKLIEEGPKKKKEELVKTMYQRLPKGLNAQVWDQVKIPGTMPTLKELAVRAESEGKTYELDLTTLLEERRDEFVSAMLEKIHD